MKLPCSILATISRRLNIVRHIQAVVALVVFFVTCMVVRVSHAQGQKAPVAFGWRGYIGCDDPSQLFENDKKFYSIKSYSSIPYSKLWRSSSPELDTVSPMIRQRLIFNDSKEIVRNFDGYNMGYVRRFVRINDGVIEIRMVGKMSFTNDSPVFDKNENTFRKYNLVVGNPFEAFFVSGEKIKYKGSIRGHIDVKSSTGLDYIEKNYKNWKEEREIGRSYVLLIGADGYDPRNDDKYSRFAIAKTTNKNPSSSSHLDIGQRFEGAVSIKEEFGKLYGIESLMNDGDNYRMGEGNRYNYFMRSKFFDFRGNGLSEATYGDVRYSNVGARSLIVHFDGIHTSTNVDFDITYTLSIKQSDYKDTGKNNKIVARQFDKRGWKDLGEVSSIDKDSLTFTAGQQIALVASSDTIPAPALQFYFNVTAKPLDKDGKNQPSIATPHWYDPVEHSSGFTGVGKSNKFVLQATFSAPKYQWLITIPPQIDSLPDVPPDGGLFNYSYTSLRVYARE